ncbi:energy-coupling factor ABC transporter ATP-binding protein [Bacillus alveayuensis]|uniref:energy-coupling factor ABC transporter ATP-binding protein n=1 Tax=Aeribacillus alveayuensis TaxID=279215 RepID=UPI0005D12193|nr:ABC transporter ATP-binding protein [Bacillus alveayuensis]
MNEVMFTLSNVSYQYPNGQTALQNITLSIKRNKKIAVLGNNGAGKSTLFFLLNGLLKPTSGTIYFRGHTLSYNKKAIRKLRKAVGIVLQDSDSQLFMPTVFEDICYGLYHVGINGKEIEKLVQQAMIETDTYHLKDRSIHSLSIGEKKRVAIAGILAINPEMFILDEPTAGLDPYYSKKMIELLNNIHLQGKTIILSTHDIELAYEWADEMIVLHKGKIVLQGSPFTVFKEEDTIQSCHLDLPWMYVLQKLVSPLDEASSINLNKKQLIQQLKNAISNKTCRK